MSSYSQPQRVSALLSDMPAVLVVASDQSPVFRPAKEHQTFYCPPAFWWRAARTMSVLAFSSPRQNLKQLNKKLNHQRLFGIIPSVPRGNSAQVAKYDVTELQEFRKVFSMLTFTFSRTWLTWLNFNVEVKDKQIQFIL